MSRNKTYLTPAQQLDRTLALVIDLHGDSVIFGTTNAVIGRMVRDTRLFRKDDIVALWFNNGGGERWPVTAVSSKGRIVVEVYVGFNTEYPCRLLTRRRRQRKKIPFESHLAVKDAVVVERRGQPLMFSELFEEWAADPTVQREIVEALRVGSVASR